MRGGCLGSFFRGLEFYESDLLLAELGSQVSCPGCVAESLPYGQCREGLLTYPTPELQLPPDLDLL